MLIEKLMSGLYMGDCARRLLLSFAQRASLFGGDIPDALTKKDSFTTAGEHIRSAAVLSEAASSLGSASEPGSSRPMFGVCLVWLCSLARGSKACLICCASAACLQSPRMLDGQTQPLCSS
jgi:hypothetical protein